MFKFPHFQTFTRNTNRKAGAFTPGAWTLSYGERGAAQGTLFLGY